MPLLEFWFEESDSGGVVMHAPGVAVVFRGELGLDHALCVDLQPDGPAGRVETWLAKSAVFSDPQIQEGAGRRIDNPVYQEVVPHELSAGPGEGLCALLTGSCLNHHFSAVFSLYREPEMTGCIVFDVDVADRCRGPVEKLAATYVVGGSLRGAGPKQVSAKSVEWQGEAPHHGRLELIAIPIATVELSTLSSGEPCAQIRAEIDPESHTQRLRYRWRWASNSELTR
jgi:hypothetical protein